MSLEKLRKAIEDLEEHAIEYSMPGSSMGPDRHVSTEEMQAIYSDIKSAFLHYEKDQSDMNLATLHDAIMTMTTKNEWIPHDSMNEIRNLLHETKSFKELEEKLKDVDYSNLEINKKDASNLSKFSNPSPVLLRYDRPEYSGSFKIKDGEIELLTSHREQHPLSAPVFLKSFFESGSHGWWHTHPLPGGGPSKNDKLYTRSWGIPLITSEVWPGGKAKFFITTPEGKTHEIRVK